MINISIHTLLKLFTFIYFFRKNNSKHTTSHTTSLTDLWHVALLPGRPSPPPPGAVGLIQPLCRERLFQKIHNVYWLSPVSGHIRWPLLTARQDRNFPTTRQCQAGS